MSKRLLVCGGRDFSNKTLLEEVLERYNRKFGISVLIHGAARGADSLAAKWARYNGVSTESFPANWKLYGKRAGFIRNTQMLVEGKPDEAIAFPGGKGTAMMVDILKKAGKKVWRIKD